MSQQQAAAEAWVTGNHKSHLEVYHTDKDCYHLRESPAEPRPATSTERDRLDKCAECDNSESTGEKTERDCPLCDMTPKNLPLHIRAQHRGGDR